MSLLDPSLVGEIRPLSDVLQSRLQKNYATLVRVHNSNDGLTAELFAANCLTSRQREY